MGKKTRKEREEKRESFASTRIKQKRKNMLMAADVFAVIAVIVGYSAYNFATGGTNVPGAPPGAGVLGDEHEHVSVLVRVFGDKFDFSGPAFQIKNSWIHFEAQDGATIHRHSSGVTMGYLFDTLGITINDECYIFPDGRQFCTNEDYSLKYYVNHEQVSDISELVLKDDAKVLISYGNESLDDIEKQLLELDAQAILA